MPVSVPFPFKVLQAMIGNTSRISARRRAGMTLQAARGSQQALSARKKLR